MSSAEGAGETGSITSGLPLFPLGTVLFPDGSLPLQIFEVRYLDMIRQCIGDGKPFGVVALTAGEEVRKPGVSEAFAEIGTLASIVEWSAPDPALLQISCRGGRRFRIVSSAQMKHGLWTADVETIEADHEVTIPHELQDTADALAHLLISLKKRSATEDMPVLLPYRLDDCGWVANRWSELLPLAGEERQRLLTLDNPLLRLELVQDLLAEQGLLG